MTPRRYHPFFITAGNLINNLHDVTGVNRDGQRIRTIHTESKDVVLEHNATGATAPLRNQSGANDTLSANSEAAEYVYDATNSEWRQT